MANRPKPVTSVYLDIADFLWTTEDVLANGPEFTAKWLRDLRACLATRDPRKSEFGARLIEQAESFRDAARQRKAASRARMVGSVQDSEEGREESHQGAPHERHEPNQPIEDEPQHHEQPLVQQQTLQALAKTTRKKTDLSTYNDPDFLAWWEKYPRKEAKVNAAKAWLANRKKMTSCDAMIETLARQIQSNRWTPDNKEYIPLPASYLNANRWTDELPPRPETWEERQARNQRELNERWGRTAENA